MIIIVVLVPGNTVWCISVYVRVYSHQRVHWTVQLSQTQAKDPKPRKRQHISRHHMTNRYAIIGE